MTWAKLTRALRDAAKESGALARARVREPASEPRPDLFGEVLDRDEFLRRLKQKMSERLIGYYDSSLVIQIIKAADFFSRSRYYPGDFATAMEIIGALLKAQKRNDSDNPTSKGSRPWRKRR